MDKNKNILFKFRCAELFFLVFGFSIFIFLGVFFIISSYWHISIIIFIVSIFLLKKSLWEIQFFEEEVILKKRVFNKKYALSYSDIEKIRIEKMIMSTSYNTRVFITFRKGAGINNLPFFQIYNTDKAFEFWKFIKNRKEQIEVKSNLNEFR